MLIPLSCATTPIQHREFPSSAAQTPRRKNAAKGITGALVYVDGIFLQILEGDRTQVQELMVNILRDLRHETVIVLRECEIACAVFGRWQMAYVSATPEEVAAWAGFNVAAGTYEAVNGGGQDPYRAEQFVQSILSLLAPDSATPTEPDCCGAAQLSAKPKSPTGF